MNILTQILEPLTEAAVPFFGPVATLALGLETSLAPKNALPASAVATAAAQAAATVATAMGIQTVAVSPIATNAINWFSTLQQFIHGWESATPAGTTSQAEITQAVHIVYTLAGLAGKTLPISEGTIDAVIGGIYSQLGAIEAGLPVLATTTAVVTPGIATPPPISQGITVPATIVARIAQSAGVAAPAHPVVLSIPVKTVQVPTTLPQAGSIPVDSTFASLGGRGANP